MANAQHTRSAHGTADEVNLEFDAHRDGDGRGGITRRSWS